MNGVNLMNIDEKKKVLFVTGMEHNIECFIKESTNLNPDNVLILQSYRPVISPFSDLMRDILMAVYQENVEEIVVTATNDDRKNPGEILNKICENKGLQEKIQTFDYLFKNCMPEFPADNLSEWLVGSKTLKNSATVIRQHPLLPLNVKVTELFLNGEIEERSEICK